MHLVVSERRYLQPLADAEHLLASYDTAARAGDRGSPSLARASIVMAASGWQAFVELVTEGFLASSEPRLYGRPTEEELAAHARDRRYWQLRSGEVMTALKRFSTPNARNSHDLLLRVGFDLWQDVEIRDGRQTLNSQQTRRRLDDWLSVRHAIAHGDHLPDVGVLDRSSAGSPMITRTGAARCLRFMRALIAHTDHRLHPKSIRHK